MQSGNERDKQVLAEGIVSFKDKYKDKIVFNPKAFKQYKHIVKEISMANYDLVDKNSLLN